jgi:hypothetical protein
LGGGFLAIVYCNCIELLVFLVEANELLLSLSLLRIILFARQPVLFVCIDIGALRNCFLFKWLSGVCIVAHALRNFLNYLKTVAG